MRSDLHRPDPIVNHSASPVDGKISPRDVAGRLLDGESLIVSDHYSTGAEVIVQLYALMRPPPNQAPYQARQRFQSAFHQASQRLLAPISNHRLALSGERPIGWLKELYPELTDFALPFVTVQELFGSWKRYQEGTHLAVLGHRLYPYYGTYAPKRTTHLELFGTWLSQYEGLRDTAVDVGTGCGVIAMMLNRTKFERVTATDINPNAIESVTRELARISPTPPIDLSCSDLISQIANQTTLIVFNPPWLQGSRDTLLDSALHFSTDDRIFERFFEQAHQKISATGRVVILFSNMIELLQPELTHPIKAELQRGRFELVQLMRRKVKPAPSTDGRQRRTKERVEVWELAPAGYSTES